MIDISQIALRVDRLLQNQRDTHDFVENILREKALKILDEKFGKICTTNWGDIGLLGLHSAIFFAGIGLAHAKKPNGDILQNNGLNGMHLEKLEKSQKRLIWNIARDKAIKLKLNQLYQLIFLLKNKDLKDVIEFLETN